ncbi:MAG: hypothetical protein M2R45_00105 [Verrucomicrobia subdivision 3 bacterium]|nr:hypothetical protein [Limisphaerales bacterium]
MKLFVYGTLRPECGHSLGRRLDEVGRACGLGRVYGWLYDFGEFPVAVPDDARGSRIVGEVFEIEAEHLFWQTLDEYEDFKPDDAEHSRFRRVEVEVMMDLGKVFQAQIYWYRLSVKGLTEIKGGDYCKDLRMKEVRRSFATSTFL